MAKITLDQLRKLREEKRAGIEMRDTQNKTVQIIIGMGTSGIAAGAKEVLEAFSKELEARKLTYVSLRQAGSIGLDHAEPVVEVRKEGMPDIIYGKVNAQVAVQIIEKHILGGELVSEHVFDRPAVDIVDKKA